MDQKDFLEVKISAENKDQADLILNKLLSKKLVTGGQMINAPARFLWKKKIIDIDYWTVTSFTINKNKETIISEVKKVSLEEVPMISFIPFDGNKELFKWIEETLTSN